MASSSSSSPTFGAPSNPFAHLLSYPAVVSSSSTSSSSLSTPFSSYSKPSTPARKRVRSDSSPTSSQDLSKSGLIQGIASLSSIDMVDMKTEDRDGEATSAGTSFSTNWTRDEDYYMEDGSCIILVEDILFNVHRSMLSRDGSTFNTLFALPQVQQSYTSIEGRSDDNPIILRGDAPTEFRHFLWALYALPPELQAVNSPEANLTQLIGIARISNKYAFKSLEIWALNAIQDYVNRKPSPILNAIPSPTTYTFFPPQLSPASASNIETDESISQLTRLISLAQLCGHEPLMNTMIFLLRQLMSTSLHYAYLAMTLADELDLKGLRGAAYLEVMQKAVVVKAVDVDLGCKPPGQGSALASSSTGALPFALQGVAPAANNAVNIAPAFSNPLPSGSNNLPSGSQAPLPITRPQRLRLLSGYYRLSLTWEQLRLAPPPFDHAPSCAATWHQHGCTQSWLEFWKEKTRGDSVLSLGSADVLGRLRVVQKEYERWGSATYMHHDCRLVARRGIAEIVRKVEESLGDYFGDVDI